MVKNQRNMGVGDDGIISQGYLWVQYFLHIKQQTSMYFFNGTGQDGKSLPVKIT